MILAHIGFDSTTGGILLPYVIREYVWELIATATATATNFGMMITAVSGAPGLVLVVLSFPSILESQSLPIHWSWTKCSQHHSKQVILRLNHLYSRQRNHISFWWHQQQLRLYVYFCLTNSEYQWS